MAGANIMGIEREEDYERITVIYATKLARSKYNTILEGLIVIEFVEDEIVCLDTNKMLNGECPVVSCLIYGERENIIIYENFYEYFLEQLINAMD